MCLSLSLGPSLAVHVHAPGLAWHVSDGHASCHSNPLVRRQCICRPRRPPHGGRRPTPLMTCIHAAQQAALQRHTKPIRRPVTSYRSTQFATVRASTVLQDRLLSESRSAPRPEHWLHTHTICQCSVGCTSAAKQGSSDDPNFKGAHAQRRPIHRVRKASVGFASALQTSALGNNKYLPMVSL